MKNKLLVGLLQDIVELPPSVWEEQVSERLDKFESEHKFITEEHRLIHHFVVRELPRTGKPLPPEVIVDRLRLSIDRVNSILEELEKNMTFLVRNRDGEIIWAFPVTIEKTPHPVTFNTGEKLYAA
jgi:hypothetical protein